jgi:hypothetical protein
MDLAAEGSTMKISQSAPTAHFPSPLALRPSTGRRLLFALLAALTVAVLLTGCASTASQPAPEQGRQVRLVGELTDNGLGCPSLRTADGQIYNLARGLEGLENGQQLEVDGYVTTMKRDCGVGTPVMPQRAVRVRAGE